MSAPKVIGLDFETQGIEERPDYPPVPVGVAVQFPGERKAKYYSWGHPTGNNCSQEQGYRVVRKAWASGTPIVFQNGKFDVDVAEVHCGVERLPWQMYHDTMFLIFLDDPHAPSYGLKPSAERILGLPPEEQDRVRDWVMAHKLQLEAEYGRFTPKEWGKHIAQAPGDLVRPYAEGDVTRTLKLFRHLYPSIKSRGMLAAYDTERHLMPILLDNERRGIRVDRKALGRDIAQYHTCLVQADDWLRKRLRVPGLNIDSDREFAAALKSSGVVTEFVKTPKGQDSVSKANLTPDMFNDRKVASVFGYRNRLTTCLKMFMEPWYKQSLVDGHIHTSWNQVRSGGGNDTSGARTGRPSTSKPNFLNLSKNFYDKGDGYVHPKHLSKLVELPSVRRYILPDKGEIFLHRDYSQQELRLLAHFENDKLAAEYVANPRMDVHKFVQEAIYSIIGVHIERRQAKVINFGLLYGMGMKKLAHDMGVDLDSGKRIKRAQLSALPGIRRVQRDIEMLAGENQPIHTLGGREYYQEPSRLINGREVNFVYKLLNYLIQGSAADVTKQAMIRHAESGSQSRFLVSVYDEINVSAPRAVWREEMELLREVMSAVDGVDIPMLSDGEYGPNWATLKPYKDRG